MKYIHAPEAPANAGPYNPAVLDGRDLYVSGQVAFIPGEEPRLDNETIEQETHRVMGNISAVLAAAGCTFDDVRKTRIFISDMRHFPEVNAAYGSYFRESKEPARECVVASPPLPDANVEISVDARRPILPKRLLRRILNAI